MKPIISAHPQAALIEAMARAAVVAVGSDPDATTVHGYLDGWNPHQAPSPPISDGGWVPATAHYSPNWMMATKQAAIMLAMSRAMQKG